MSHPYLRFKLLTCSEYPSLQLDASNNETFAPGYISLTTDEYTSMIDTLHLPHMAIETGSAVGILFWFGLDPEGEGNRHLR